MWGFRTGASAMLAATAAALTLYAQPAVAATFTASPSVADGTTTSCNPGPCSLREAINEASSSSDATNTVFVPAGTYTLTQGSPLTPDPQINTTLEIIGQGTVATDTVVNANQTSDVFNVGGTGTVDITDIEITGGLANNTSFPYPANGQSGGGIYVNPNATLNLKDSDVYNNTAVASGGGIDTNGDLTVEESLIDSNTVTGANGPGIGGGIDNFNENVKTQIVNSTIYGNSVAGGTSAAGGGIYNGSANEFDVVNSTIAGNTAPSGHGGGLAGGANTLVNTILAKQTGGGDCDSTHPTSAGHNIADDSSCNLTGAGDQQSTDPKFVLSGSSPDLTDNGGPTDTIALQSSSPAVGAALESSCPTTDQREYMRSSPCSIGAYEFGAAAVTYTVTGTSNPSAGGSVVARARPGGNCSANSCTVVPGTNVYLTATAAPGYRFAGWSGDCSGTSSICALTDVQRNEAATASFVQQVTITGVPSYQELSVVASDSSPTASCSGGSCTVDAGDTVTLTATGNQQFQFQGWLGGSCQGSANPCTITNVRASETDEATFVLGPPPPRAGTEALYVSATTGNDANPGTAARPFYSLQRALQEYEYLGGSTVSEILMAEGTYSGALGIATSITFTNADDTVMIYGDLDPTTWQPVANPTNPTTITGSPQAILLDGTGITLQQLTLQATPDASGSDYGARLINGSSLRLIDVTIHAANALAGADGAAGARGNAGQNGGIGGNGDTPAEEDCWTLGFPCGGQNGQGGQPGIGAEGGNNYGGGANELNSTSAPAPTSAISGGDGGYGGFGNSPSSSYGACQPNTSPALCGPAYPFPCTPYQYNGASYPPGYVYDPSCSANTGYTVQRPVGTFGGQTGSYGYNNGQTAAGGAAGVSVGYGVRFAGNGGTGASGAAGAQGQNGANPTSQGDTWIPGTGGTGLTGVPGGGGGGGGSGFGDSGIFDDGVGNGGGGGGGGGGPGLGGAGGAGGGGSFGVYLDGGSSVTVEYASVIAAENGGNGGNGGPGGTGGPGGAGGPGGTNDGNDLGYGGSGGSGGSGGPGGPGGGGAGGPSYAIFTADAASGSQVSTDSILTAGTPGAGGVPGSPGSTPAPSGGGGASHPCSAGCGVSANVPSFPAYILVSGHTLITELECKHRCTGTVTISVASTAASARGIVLGRLRFSLAAHRATALRVPLDARASRLLAHRRRVLARLTVLVKVGRTRPVRYVQAILLTHTRPSKPKRKHLPAPPKPPAP